MNPIKILTENETATLLNFVATTQKGYKTDRTKARNTLLILLMLDAGLRVGEVVNLIWADLLVSMHPVHTLILRGPTTKTGKPREIPLSDRLQDAIRMWFLLTTESDWVPTTTTIFPARRQSARLSTRQVQRIVQCLGWAALHRSITPHMLRHTFATRLMKVTDMRTVQTLLGHESIQSTQVYTHPSTTDQQDAIKKITNGEPPESLPRTPDKS
jgi:site-specific recombinase XerD